MNLKNKSQKNQSRQKKPTINVSKNNQNKWVWYALAVVLITTFSIYFKAIKFDFLQWDDDLYITLNKDIKELNWANIKLFFTEFYAGNYQPITLLMYAIEYKIGAGHATIFHFNNILLHIINTLLVFALIKKISPQNCVVALITAAFFAIHPMHVESVAWVSELKDVLYSFFFLLSLIVYTNYIKSDNLKQLVLVGVLFVLSCLSKSAAVILPLVLLLFDYYLGRKYSSKMFVEKLPFFASSLIFGIVAMNSQKAAMPVKRIVHITDQIFIVSNSFITYIVKAFAPLNLSALYPYPVELGGTLPVIYYLSIVFVGFAFLFVWYSRKWGKDVIFGFSFFVITIILVLQIVSVGNATMADRYTYIPYIGVFFIVGKLYEYLSATANKNYFLIVLSSGFIIFSSVSNARIEKWENDGTLFSDVIEKYPLNPLAYNNRGCYNLKIAHKDSLNSAKKMYFKKSFDDFNKVIELDENYSNIYHSRGLASYFLKDYVNAIKDFDKEIQKDPKNKELYFDRGNAKKENLDYTGAIADFDKTIELSPKSEDAYFNRGNVKKDINDFSGALKDYDKAIELNPAFIKAYNNRSMLRCILKDYEGTIADYDKMIELNPKDTITTKNRNIIKSLLVK